MTRPQTVAVVLGLAVIFVAALLIGIGDGVDRVDGVDSPLEAQRVGSGESSPALRTAAFTVVIGVAVFVIGQVVQRFIIEPIQEQRTLRKEIAYVVLSYDTTRSLKKAGLQREVAQNLRRLSGQLRSTLWTVPYYRLFVSLGAVKKEENVLSASEALAGWAASVRMDENSSAARHRSTVSKALNIPQA